VTARNSALRAAVSLMDNGAPFADPAAIDEVPR